MVKLHEMELRVELVSKKIAPLQIFDARKWRYDSGAIGEW